MKGLLRQDRGVSEMVGYVLLIVIAVGISLLVYSFLKLYVPKEKAECPDDISIILQDFSCKAGSLSIIIENKGFFTIDGAYVRFGEAGSRVKELTLNKISNYTCVLFNDLNQNCRSAVASNPAASYVEGLKPEKILNLSYANAQISLGNKEVEIEPVILAKSKQVLCSKAVITQPIKCE